MKKRMAVITALAIGVGCCTDGMTAGAVQKEDDEKEDTAGRQESYILDEVLSTETDWDKAYELLSENASGDPKMNSALLNSEGMGLPEEIREKADELEEKTDNGEKEQDREGQGAKALQMPQKLEVTIDPWEVDGKGQIHSEQYVIRNAGEDTGVLTLSGLTCRPREGSDVFVRTEQDGIHDDENKSVYMEMLFGTGERIVLSEESAKYQTELKPGEEITLEFAGEVNEYASGIWDNRDVAVGVVYSWKLEERTDDMSGDVQREMSGDVSGDAAEKVSEDISGDVSGDVSGDAKEGVPDASGDIVVIEPGDDAQDPSGDGLKTGQTEVREDGGMKDDGSEKDELRDVDINLSGDAELHVDSWVESENGNLASTRYVMRNTGSVPGTLKLSDPICRLAYQNETVIKMKLNCRENLQSTEKTDGEGMPQNTEEMERTGKDSIWIELTAEQGENFAVEQEYSEVLEYETELEPGEELIISFFIRPEEMLREELKAGRAAVSVSYSWNLNE